MRSGLLLLVLSSLAIPRPFALSPNRHRAFGFAKVAWMVSNSFVITAGKTATPAAFR